MKLQDKIMIHIHRLILCRSWRVILKDMIGLTKRRLYHTEDPEEHLKQFMDSNGKAFIDVGASIGMWTFFLANKNVECYAFEPSPIAFGILEKVARHYPNVKAYPFALGEKESIANLNVHSHPGYDSMLYKSKEFWRQIPVKIRTLDSFNFQDVGLIKIDTEGYEIPVLLGARETIRKWRPRLIIEVHTPFEQEQKKILGILKELNYRWIITHKLSGQPHVIGDSKRRKKCLEVETKT